MKPTTWLYIGAVILLLLAAAGICLGGFILLGAAGGAQGVTGIGSVGVVAWGHCPGGRDSHDRFGRPQNQSGHRPERHPQSGPARRYQDRRDEM